MKFVLRRNLLIGFAVSLLLLIVSSVASYKSIDNLLYNQQLVNHTNSVINRLENVMSVLKDAETAQRGFLLTNEEDFLLPYTGAFGREDRLIDDIKDFTKDNLEQQKDVDFLRSIVTSRINYLQNSINKKRRGEQPSFDDLQKGREQMDQARSLVGLMENRERYLLQQRTNDLSKFVKTTPKLIIGAALLAVIVTIFFFIKTNTDLNQRIKLQEELEKKDQETSSRIAIINEIAETISSGNYKTRISDATKDTLGSVAASLNKMASSLDESFQNLSNNEWLQKGIAGLNEKMLGEKNIDVLSYNIIEFITQYTGAPIGAFYTSKNHNELILTAAVSINKSNIKKQIQFGEGIAGQCAQSRKIIFIKVADEAELIINYAAGSIKPTTIIAVPVCFENNLNGVAEIGFINEEINPITEAFLKAASENISMAINSAQANMRLEELLHETQSQAEELQAQHSEMEDINTELEAQAEKLQASEEELRVQQEELQQANQELEERSRLLEERNEMIMERNLEIQAKAKEIELSTKYKSEFLANMSHELRTPLNSILLLSRLLADNHTTNLSKDEIEYAQVIENSGRGLLTLIDEILDLSKIEAGKMSLEFKEVQIKDVITELKMLFTPVAYDKNILFEIELEKDVPEKIETDRLRLDQILRNLISNALKFTKEGSVKTIVSTKEDVISFCVKDTGIGIPPEKQETIFDAFQQADGSTRRQFGGTGLGLSISRELAKLLGGEVILKSEEGSGSEFTLWLPLNQSITYQPKKREKLMQHVPALMAQTIASKSVSKTSIPATVADDRDSIENVDKVILIVEDDIAFANALLEFARRNNYKGIVAVRGDEGIELAKKYLPLGILLDIQLPVKNGWEVMEELKANNITKSIPVHIMSSSDVKSKSISAGAIDFINKPVAFDKMSEIFKKIEDALSRYPKKVLIVEENTKHAQALAYFLENNNITSELKHSVEESITALNNDNVDCIILNLDAPILEAQEKLSEIKNSTGLEHLPIIVFTAKNLSHNEEMRIKQYADSIVIKTAHSYQRILDEISLFLHLVEENKKPLKTNRYKNTGDLGEVLKGKTVLIADDDVRNIFSLTKSLEKYDMKIVSAMDGKDALKQLAENKIDIVLMDMMMPEMDGYESIQHIRKNIQYRNLPVIAVTAKAMVGDREKTINAGASDYITKPVDVDQLTSLLRVWLYES